jgi:hypothetical protein
MQSPPPQGSIGSKPSVSLWFTGSLTAVAVVPVVPSVADVTSAPLTKELTITAPPFMLTWVSRLSVSKV